MHFWGIVSCVWALCVAFLLLLVSPTAIVITHWVWAYLSVVFCYFVSSDLWQWGEDVYQFRTTRYSDSVNMKIIKCVSLFFWLRTMNGGVEFQSCEDINLIAVKVRLILHFLIILIFDLTYLQSEKYFGSSGWRGITLVVFPTVIAPHVEPFWKKRLLWFEQKCLVLL